jgi:methyl-accepting chemotaxis protein
LVRKTGNEFEAVCIGSKRVANLVGESAVASSEQYQGIKQINIAIHRKDKTIRQDAANAEEAVSARKGTGFPVPCGPSWRRELQRDLVATS